GTGSISEDGSVLASDPGVGIIKGGWHCGGNPATSGTASCLSVSGSPGGGFGPGSGGSGSGSASADLTASAFAPVGSIIDITAAGTPAPGGSYSWQIVDDPADATDDPSVAAFTSTPVCAGQPTCIGKLKGLKPGTVSVQIVFTSAAGGTVQSVTSPIRKVLFVGVTLQWLLFENNHDGMTRDEFGSFPYVMPAIQWARNPPSMATPLEQYPVWYLHSTPAGSGSPTPRKIRMAVKLNFNPVLPAGLSNAKLAGSSSQFTFKLNNVVVPPGQPYIIREVEADVALPEETKVYRPLTIDWTFQANGGAVVPLGKTANRIYVTLDPISSALVVPQTVVDLAVGTGGAGTLQEAADATWRLFSPADNGPGDVKTWDGRELIYYAQAAATMGEPDTAHSDAIKLLGYQSGQCRTFVDLIALAWAVNGVDHVRTKVTARDGKQMLIGSWQFPFQLFPDYVAFFYDNDVPHQPGTYGDLVSLPGIPGQNSSTPGRKLFDNHVILRSKINGVVSSTYFDPSYGRTYLSENDFESKAVDGYAYHSIILTLTARPRTTLGNIQFGPEP
ncbi:MAG: hypothetical protein JWN02_371, partial [Acidobacteria bacterium]|nr:hypothetical protein [Acidobacteriota bacterium]